jgi:hypothetical protein
VLWSGCLFSCLEANGVGGDGEPPLPPMRFQVIG